MQEGECGEARERQPSFPDTHSALTFCFVLLTGLRLPVLEKAKEEDQRPWKHHLRESHDPGPPSVFFSTSLLTPHSLLQHFPKELPFTTAKSLIPQHNLPQPIKPCQSKYSDPTNQWGFECMQGWMWSSTDVYWVPGILLHLWDTIMKRMDIFLASRNLHVNADMQAKQNKNQKIQTRKNNMVVY